jgi:hypothetical protein
MQNQFIITIDEHTPKKFALDFLRNVNFIKSIKSQKDELTEIDEISLMSEKTLSVEWNSEEDNRWDKLLQDEF